jgi:hypothetical protein
MLQDIQQNPTNPEVLSKMFKEMIRGLKLTWKEWREKERRKEIRL